MKTIKVSLNSIDKVKTFVNEIIKYDFDFDLVSGRYVIDAKSIMGIFSLDLSKPCRCLIKQYHKVNSNDCQHESPAGKPAGLLRSLVLILF